MATFWVPESKFLARAFLYLPAQLQKPFGRIHQLSGIEENREKNMRLKTKFYWSFAVLVLASSAHAVAVGPALQNPSESNPTALPSRQQPTEYVLGPNDQIVISA